MFLAHLVGAETICLLVGLDREAVVQQEAMIAFLPVAVIHLRPPPDAVQRGDREAPPLVIVRPLRLSWTA